MLHHYTKPWLCNQPGKPTPWLVNTIHQCQWWDQWGHHSQHQAFLQCAVSSRAHGRAKGFGIPLWHLHGYCPRLQEWTRCYEVRSQHFCLPIQSRLVLLVKNTKMLPLHQISTFTVFHFCYCTFYSMQHVWFVNLMRTTYWLVKRNIMCTSVSWHKKNCCLIVNVVIMIWSKIKNLFRSALGV